MSTYFIHNRFDGCNYYRCILPQRELGWKGDRMTLGDERVSPEVSANNSISADNVIFQRPDDDSRLTVAWRLKQLGKKIIFENDDTYKNNDQMKFKGQLEKRIETLDDFIRISDLVITTTEFLADEYKQINKNVVVCPNAVEPLDWPIPKRNESDVCRIGIVGSVAMNYDFEPIRELLQDLGKRKDIQLVLFSLPPKAEDKKTDDIVKGFYVDEFAFWKTINVEWVPFVPMEEYFETLNNLKLDIMLIPREDSYFNRCKSNCKFLEASMLEIPVIAQGFPDEKSPYQVSKNDKDYMFIANTKEDWKEMTEKLIESKELREDMGEKAHKYVLENYHIKKLAPLWRDAINKLS
ncbi:MAG: hypothetical protein WCN88_04800 [Candidatus Falkowbacteria bacterium]